MVRYTKLGILDGETNLQLPALTEHLIEVRGWALVRSMLDVRPRLQIQGVLLAQP
jgi:hypothetical protein